MESLRSKVTPLPPLHARVSAGSVALPKIAKVPAQTLNPKPDIIPIAPTVSIQFSIISIWGDFLFAPRFEAREARHSSKLAWLWSHKQNTGFRV